MSTYTDYIVNNRAICIWGEGGERITIALDSVLSVMIQRTPPAASLGVVVIFCQDQGHTINLSRAEAIDLEETLSNWLLYGDSPEADAS